MKKIERKLHQISGSLLISLPKAWTNQYNLSKGAHIEIGFKEDGTLVIAPKIEDVKKITSSNIVYDKFLVRRFFRDYFSGTDFIRVLFNEKISKAEKKKIYDTVQNLFMNVHVTEETPKSMMLQNFRLEGISIQSCFQRMNHIVSSMFEDVLKSDFDSIDEKEKNFTRFYYMGIRLIRQYLQEGGYVQSSEISLVDAMDYRLASEKLERIADELKTLTGNDIDKEVTAFGGEVYKKYQKIIPSFLKQNFELAVQMWGGYERAVKEGRALEKKLMKNKDFRNIQYLNCYLKILEYTKDISNLVRGGK